MILVVLGFKTSLDIFPISKNFQRNNHNSFVDFWIIKEVSPILITPEKFFLADMMIEAVDPTQIDLTSMSNIYKVFDNLHGPEGC